jgi:hypothetical protein
MLTHRAERGVGPVPAALRRIAAARDREQTGALIEPLARSLAVAGIAAASSPPSGSAQPGASLSALELAAFEDVVRRVSWGGDRRRGVARIELGGEYAGTSVIIRGEGRELSLRVEVARGADARDLPARLVERLAARGLQVTDIEIA